MASYDVNELPLGWVREYNDTYNHPYWVDTQSNPPRAIWTHPYEDEQFLDEHPQVRARFAKGKGNSNQTAPRPKKAGPSQTDIPAESPPPYDPNDAPRRHSFNGRDKQSSDNIRPAHLPQPVAGTSRDSHKRGFFGKLKDKAIGTKEEREEAKRQEALLMQRRAEERRRMIEEQRRQQDEWLRQQQAAGPSGVYYQQPVYAAPFGSPYGRSGYGGYGGFGHGGSPYGQQQRRGGAGNLALPIIGGLAGGLLLGDLLGGF
ncbi:hypothetical protein BDY19DRAFT_914507 [Irpex rosettiformis]|uniref:Uncharacterized protein n=1 Tax=Irpex rosettiformis TaxID=378272 RepID=A0ACB8UKG8_9APHY|nr:hypothetical protein BDY19DRAFT_914507 [Irpex rosettiformis]